MTTHRDAPPDQRVSLTGHLKNPVSSVREWFAERSPHTARLATEVNHQLPARPDNATANSSPVRPTCPRCRRRLATLRSPRLPSTCQRAALRAEALAHSGAATGAATIVVGSGTPPALNIEREAVARIGR